MRFASKFLTRVIPMSTFFGIQALISSIVGFFYGRKRFWPGIDSIPVMEKRVNPHENFLNLDLFTMSSIQKSGRGSYLFLLETLSNFFNLDSIQVNSLLSAFTVCFATSLTLIAFFLSVYSCRENSCKIVLSPLEVLLLSLPIATYPRVFLIPGVTISGYDPFVVSWARPEMISILLTSIGLILFYNNLNRSSRGKIWLVMLIIFFATLIHPTASLFFSLLWILLRTTSGLTKLKTNAMLLIPISIAFLALRFVLYDTSSNLSSHDFVNIYANWRHPHHFWPSYYLSSNNVILIITLTVFVYILGRVSRHSEFRNLWFWIAAWFVGINLLQFIGTEILFNSFFTILGPSRGNLFILLAIFSISVVVISSTLVPFRKPTTPIMNHEIDARKKFPSTFNGIVGGVVILSLLITYSYVKHDYDSYAKEVFHVVDKLKLSSSDLILVDPLRVDSTGWREFAHLQIFLDSYFMFNLSAIPEYRSRWIKVCGQNRLSDCTFHLEKANERQFLCFLSENYITKIVVDRRNDFFDVSNYPSFRVLGTSGNLISYIKPLSTRHRCGK